MLVLTFHVGAERYALPCRHLVEVIPLVTLRPVPQAPRWLAGMFTLRGTMVPVIDLCQLMLGTPCPDRLSSRIMLARVGEGLEERVVGLLAEKVTEAITLKGKGSSISVPGAAYLGDLYLDDGGVQLLKLEKLVPETILLLGAVG